MNARIDFSSLTAGAVGGDTSPRGYASIVQLEPDMGAFERVNVGVLVVSSRGKRYVKVLTQFDRLACLYGKELAELLEFMTDATREALLADGKTGSDSASLTAPLPFFNVEPEAYVDQLFAAVVPAAKLTRAPIDSSSQRTTDKLWNEVHKSIKQLVPERADDIIANVPFTTVATRKGPQRICVPLTPPRGAGALESAAFALQTTQIKLMRALLDVELAVESKRLPSLGFFIGRPARMRDPVQLKGLDRVIDEVAARVPAYGVVEVSDSPSVLARSIVDWADSIPV